MKRLFSFLTLFVAAFAMTACQNPDVEETPGLEKGKEIKISAQLGDFSRVAGTSFEEGDAVSLLAYTADDLLYINNACFTYAAGEFTAPETYYWPEDEAELVFVSVYPYSTNYTGCDGNYIYPLNLPTDQTTHEAYTSADVMVTTYVGNSTSEAVVLNYRRVNARVDFALDNQLGEEIASVELGNVCPTNYLYINCGPKASDELDRGGILISEPEDDFTTSMKAGYGVTGEGDAVWSLILPKQTVVNPTLKVTTVSGAEYNYVIEGEMTLALGCKYTAAVTLQPAPTPAPEQIEVSWTINDWAEGGNLEFVQVGDAPAAETWGIVGDFNGWGYSPEGNTDVVLAYEKGLYTAEVTLFKGQGFKLRKDYAWDENRGWAAETVDQRKMLTPSDEFFPVMDKGGNIYVTVSGTYQITWNSLEETMQVALLSEVDDNWALIGSFAESDWTNDYPMEFVVGETSMYYTVELDLEAGDEFKFRCNGAWDVNYGLNESTAVEQNVNYGLTQDGANIVVPEKGTYVIVFNVMRENIYVNLTWEKAVELATGPFTSQWPFACTSNLSENALYTFTNNGVNGQEASGFKLGSSKKAGLFASQELNYEGDNTLSFYALAWSGKTATLYVRVDGGEAAAFELASNPGVSSVEPYTIEGVTVNDLYTLELKGLTKTSVIEFSTDASFSAASNTAGRAVVFGINLATAPEEPAAPEVYPYNFKRAEEIVSGKTYLMLTDDSYKMALPISKNYGYFSVTDGDLDADGLIGQETLENAFQIDAVEGGYVIRQADGRYVYMSGTYNSFNLAAELKADYSYLWSIDALSNDPIEAFKVTNIEKGKYMQYEPSYGSFGCYDTEKEGAMLNLFYELVEQEGLNLGDPVIPETPEEPETPADPVKATVAEFLAAAEDATVYELTGTITGTYNTTHGNFYLKDETGEVLIYGLLTPDGVAQKQYTAAGLKDGDTITLQTVRTSFNGAPQGKNAIYVSHVSVEVEKPEVDPSAIELVLSNYFSADTTLATAEGATYAIGDFDFTFTKFNNSSATNYNANDGGIRFYKDDVMKIDAKGKTIKQIIFTTYGGKFGPVWADAGSYDSATYTWSGSAKTVIFTATAQMRFNKLTITVE